MLASANNRNRLMLALLVLAIGGLILRWTLTETIATAEAKEKGNVASVIRANEFAIVDAGGNLRASLSMGKHGPGLVLNDENGTTRL